jgi:hypothetical protein
MNLYRPTLKTPCMKCAVCTFVRKCVSCVFYAYGKSPLWVRRKSHVVRRHFPLAGVGRGGYGPHVCERVHKHKHRDTCEDTQHRRLQMRSRGIWTTLACFCCALFSWDRVLLCSPVWPQTCDLPASTSQMLSVSHISIVFDLVVMSYCDFCIPREGAACAKSWFNRMHLWWC